jgi:hypothetical protein
MTDVESGWGVLLFVILPMFIMFLATAGYNDNGDSEGH